jgi:uncharacterized membrane protein
MVTGLAVIITTINTPSLTFKSYYSLGRGWILCVMAVYMMALCS